MFTNKFQMALYKVYSVVVIDFSLQKVDKNGRDFLLCRICSERKLCYFLKWSKIVPSCCFLYLLLYVLLVMRQTEYLYFLAKSLE